MLNYQQYAENFDLNQAAQEFLSGDLNALNACVECCDRHALPYRIALFWQGKDGGKLQYTFTELQKRAAQFANFLKANGVGKGDRVSGLLPRTPELIITILATWRIGAVYQPLFTAFGPKAIEHRVNLAKSKFVVTDVVNREKLKDVDNCPAIVTVTGDKGTGLYQGDYSFWAEVERQSSSCPIEYLNLDDPFLLMFTSGTTGLQNR